MDLDQYLETVDVIDCTGQVTHTLTLQIDGTVEIAFASGRRATADPATRSCTTPGMSIPEGLWPEIMALRV